MTDAMSAPPPSGEPLRPCPWCAELIQAAAVLCAFCQRDLGGPSPGTANSSPPPLTPSARRTWEAERRRDQEQMLKSLGPSVPVTRHVTGTPSSIGSATRGRPAGAGGSPTPAPAGCRWWVVAVVLGVMALAGAIIENGDGGGAIDPNEQHDGCHRQALAWASNSDPSFEWNGAGMDTYRSEYESCMQMLEVAGP